MDYPDFMIRQETTEDFREVYDLVKTAFSEADHADGNEQDLVSALRSSEAFIPELSLVAERDGQLAGHILFTKALVGASEVIALAPLSVHPDFQRQGIGSALVREGHRIAKELGYPCVLVLGSNTYYQRFGYREAVEYDIELPEGFPEEFFMAAWLADTEASIHGAVTYAPEFGL